MTDNEIIKALECCRSSRDLTACKGCPALEYDLCACGTNVLSEGLVNELVDLINRLKAENERLQSIVNMDLAFVGVRNGKSERAKQIIRIRMNEVKAEAIKEFVKRLEKRKTSICGGFGMSSDVVDMDTVYNVRKEMVGEEQCMNPQ